MLEKKNTPNLKSPSKSAKNDLLKQEIKANKEEEKNCEKLEGDPDSEVISVLKKSLFDNKNKLSMNEGFRRLFTLHENPYYRDYEKKHGSYKLLNDTLSGIASGCYDGYAMNFSFIEPKSLDNSMDSVGSAGSSVGDLF